MIKEGKMRGVMLIIVVWCKGRASTTCLVRPAVKGYMPSTTVWPDLCFRSNPVGRYKIDAFNGPLRAPCTFYEGARD
jgi:hypothetical protein